MLQTILNHKEIVSAVMIAAAEVLLRLYPGATPITKAIYKVLGIAIPDRQ